MKISKKIISILLSAVMIAVIAIPAFAAETDNEHPTIYVTGAQVNELIDAEGNVIYPNDVDAGQVIKDALMPCLKKLLSGFLTGDYKPYVEEFQKAFSPIFADRVLDENGEASDGSHSTRTIYNCNMPGKTSGYSEYDYELGYDWRLSPLTTADELKIFIEKVKADTGEDKVNLMGRCYGANVVAAYLEKYKDHAIENVADVSYLSSSILGIDMLDAIFTGEMVFEDQAISNFVDYFMEGGELIEDEATASLITSLVEVFNQVSVLGYTGEMLGLLIDEIKYDLFPALLLDSYGTMPSYWSMVSPDKYKDAIDFVFPDAESKAKYAKLIEKTEAYYREVQLNFEETTAYLTEKGINFNFFVKYNFPDIPIYAGATQQGDGTTSVYKQSLGATAADFGKILDDDYLNSLETYKYLSPDLIIDASTCLYPETTWFVKDLHHETFPHNFNNLAIEVMKNDYTVSDGEYAQFLQWEDGDIVGEVEKNYAPPAQESKKSALFKFITAIIKMILNLFKGVFA